MDSVPSRVRPLQLGAPIQWNRVTFYVPNRFVPNSRLQRTMTKLFRRMFLGFRGNVRHKTLTIVYNNDVTNMNEASMREACIRCGARRVDPTSEQDTSLKMEQRDKCIVICFVDGTPGI